MVRQLEVPRRNTHLNSYSLEDTLLPMGLTFAQRRSYTEHLAHVRATSSDGSTTGNDGNDPADNEEFDFISDD